MSGQGCDPAWLARLPGLVAELEPYREMLLANVVMVGEIPAPTFGEEQRIDFVKQRFIECGLQSSSSDEVGNGLGIIPGSRGQQTLLLSAHADIPFAAGENHTFSVEPAAIRGPGVADNSLGVAALITLPTILERLGIRLESNLLLMASTRSLEKGNQQGIRFFLENTTLPITTAIALEGTPLGRLHYRSLASLGGIISCHVDRKLSDQSAIEVLNRLISRLGEIPLSRETNTACVLGSISGGATYKLPARTAQLAFQVRSDTDESVAEVNRLIHGIIDELSSGKSVSVQLEVIARTRAGGLPSTHPLVEASRKIMGVIGIQPRHGSYSSTISPYVEQGIPALCLGLSQGENVNYLDEYVEIEPLLSGMAQLIGLLVLLDGGRDE
ncbi:zinc-binding metallopeptidase family protein [Desulfogranum mediterraneum]|uniref:hypothetical protein n=1 Tax=Desulfogranum mediterraneum TaxID=160661 RepID=UPI0004047228|nr:hypothetical protein [Desulfogranum mediterraneum]